jgi:hypothetical protein
MRRSTIHDFKLPPNSLIEYDMNALEGPGRKGRLRRKPRPDIAFYRLDSGLPQNAAGAGKACFRIEDATPATAEKE